MEASFDPEQVVAFWREAGPPRWFAKDRDFDAEVRRRFLRHHEAAVAGALAAWEEAPASALALLIVLDQFPRNIFRDDARAYAADAQARGVADRAMARGFDRAFDNPYRRFFYLPLMHSEDLADQERCIRLCRDAADPEGVKFAEIHADIIRRFGRFPHRNAELGRPSTEDEEAFLAAGGFAG